MVLDVKKLFIGKAKEISGSYQLNLSDVSVAGVFPFTATINVYFDIENKADIIRLKAKTAFDFLYPCSRCMKDVLSHVEYEFSHILVSSLADKDIDEEYVILKDYKIDLDEILREDILLQLPTKVLCSSDCKGLCPKCGKDLNDGACNCTDDFIDPRLEVLKGLLS